MIQDVFEVFESFYTAGSEAQWKKPSFEPVDVTRYDMIEAPAILIPRSVVPKVGDLVRAASFVFNKKLVAVFLDRLDWLRLDVVIAVRHAENVPSDALAGYAINDHEARVMQAVDQTHTPVVF